MFVVSYGRYTLLFDSIKLKLISKLSKRKEVISTEYTGKNQIFELIGIPLLRLSTKGSGEETKIKEQLDKHLDVGF